MLTKLLVTLFMTTTCLSWAGMNELWDGTVQLPSSTAIIPLKEVRFSVIKKREPELDGISWLHGVTLTPHTGWLSATWGANRQDENTPTEVVQYSVSKDNGQTWSTPATILEGPAGVAASHGTTIELTGRLWGFFPRFEGVREKVRVEAMVLEDQSQQWTTHGIVIGDRFWPMGAPTRLGNGNYLIPGIQVGGEYESSHNPPAVAISQGEDFSHWKVVVIPKDKSLEVWGESAVITEGKDLLLISRGWSASPWAFVSMSHDYGETWSTLEQSNLPMSPTKPFAGTLSTGAHYLIGTTCSDCGCKRYPLTIALTDPGRMVFSRIYSIRNDICSGPGESVPGLALAYPYAAEHEGSLYVVYSNDGGRGANLNSAELAVIPLAALQDQ